MVNKQKKLGIVGGLGPESTVDFYQKILLSTPASKDQEHIPTIIYINPQIPDRTKAIINGGENPYPYLLDSCKKLEKCGADFIVISCNTAHYYIKDLQKNLSIPIINMIEETVNFIKKNYPVGEKIGLLATTGTIFLGLYTKLLEKEGYEVITLDKDMQERYVMGAIYGPRGIKSGFKSEPKKLLTNAANQLKKKGAKIIIKGCTEIGMVLNPKNSEMVFIDPSLILARVCVNKIIFDGEIKSSLKQELTGKELVTTITISNNNPHKMNLIREVIP